MDEFDDNEIARLLRCSISRLISSGRGGSPGLRRSNFLKDLSATGDGSRRSPEPARFVGAGKRGRGMEPYISGGHADFQDAAGSPFQ